MTDKEGQLNNIRLIDANELKKQFRYTDDMSDLIDLKDVTSMVVALNAPIATKEKILDMLGDWKPVVTTDANYYPEHKLQPVVCVNCGGRIDKDTMTCCYCGTYYR